MQAVGTPMGRQISRRIGRRIRARSLFRRPTDMPDNNHLRKPLTLPIHDRPRANHLRTIQNESLDTHAVQADGRDSGKDGQVEELERSARVLECGEVPDERTAWEARI